MDPFETLGVARSAPDSVIKAAYRARIKETHPDAGGDPAAAQQVNDAYAVLTDPARRAEYERCTAPSAPGPEPVRTDPAPGHPGAAPAHREPAVTAPDVRPDLVYSTCDPPRPWLRRRAAWVPVLAAIAVAGLAAGVAGAVGMVAAAATGAWWTKRNVLIGAALAAAPMLLDLGTAGAVRMPQTLLLGVPVLLYALVLGGWALVRERTRRERLTHIGDMFVTTRDRYGLEMFTLTAVTPTPAGTAVAHLEPVDGPWRQVQVRADGIAEVGDVVLITEGRILTSASAEALDRYRRAAQASM